MYIKRYSVGAFILMISVGWYIFAFVTHENVGFDFFGVPLPKLPIAVWVVIPVAVLYIGSVLHMMVYSAIGSFKLRKYEKDYETIIDAIVEAYLGKKDRHHSFKTERYKLLGILLDNTTLFPNQTMGSTTSNEKINEVMRLIDNIKSGEVVDLKKYSLSSSNPLVVQNERNRYKKGDLSAEDILSNQSKYDDSLCKEVYLEYIKTAPLSSIEKYKKFIDKEGVFLCLARVNAEEFTLEMSNESIISLLKMVELSEKELIKVSSILSQSMIPEQRMKLFETLSETNEDAMSAYLYTLFDLELLELADEILDNSQPDEYLIFKAFRTLKESNKNFNINLFV